jgi:hypothetical protein
MMRIIDWYNYIDTDIYHSKGRNKKHLNAHQVLNKRESVNNQGSQKHIRVLHKLSPLEISIA